MTRRPPASDAKSDTATESFLSVIAGDIARHPETAVLDFPVHLLERMDALTKGMEVDPDMAIKGAVDL